MDLSEADRQRIVEWARRHPKIRQVWLYGSRARGDNRPDSDIDLAIEMDFLDWFHWVNAFKKNLDLHLEHEVQLEWYEKGAGLKLVESGVESDGVLVYPVV